MPSHPVPMIDDVRPVTQRTGGRSNSSRSAKAPMPPPAIAIRIPLRLAGMLLLALCAIVLASLASWSVDDPSLSLATSKTPANWLGYPGAVIADLVFQFLGLAGLVMVVPLALWGWAMARRHQVTRFGLRALSWVGATILFAGVFAFIAMPESWPLPTGLGGLTGMLFNNLSEMIVGAAPPPITPTLFAIILAAPALARLWLAMGIGTSVPVKPQTASARAAQDDDRDPNPLVEVVMGAVVHTGYSMRTAFRRARAEHAARRAEEPEDFIHDREPSLDPREPSIAPEPVVTAAPQRRIHAPAAPFVEPTARIKEQPEYDDTAIDYPEIDEDDVPF